MDEKDFDFDNLTKEQTIYLHRRFWNGKGQSKNVKFLGFMNGLKSRRIVGVANTTIYFLVHAAIARLTGELLLESAIG